LALYIFPIMSFLSQVAVVVIVILVRRHLTPEMKVLAGFFILALAVGILQLTLALNGIRNLWTAQLFLPIEFTLLLLVFYYAPGLHSMRPILLTCITLFLAVFIWSAAGTETPSSLYPYLKTAAAIVLVTVSCYVLIVTVKDEEPRRLARSVSWVASANLVYFASTAVLYALSGTIFQTSTQTMRISPSASSSAPSRSIRRLTGRS